MNLPRTLTLLVAAAVVLPAPASAAGESAIFYYPWYGTRARDGAWLHWNQNGWQPPFEIASNFFPARGPYSSGNPRVLAGQMNEIAAAGVHTVVTSWWGFESIENARLPAVLKAAKKRRLSVAAHLEPYRGRTIERTLADIDYLRTLGITEFYVYRPRDFPADAWAGLNESLTGVRILAQTSLVGFAAAAGFDGVYTYDVLVYGGGSFGRLCEQAHRAGLLCAPSVGPGYVATRATDDLRMKPRRRGATYDRMWTSALRAHPDLVTITSYNEWNEGTQIEPADSAGPPGYLSYDGAYGLRGAASEHAYLDRTAYWTRLFERGG